MALQPTSNEPYSLGPKMIWENLHLEDYLSFTPNDLKDITYICWYKTIYHYSNENVKEKRM